MNILVGKALEEDEQFWNTGIFAGAAEAEVSDEDYNSKEESDSAGIDSFDSDFDRPDNDLEDDDDISSSDDDSSSRPKKKVLKKRKRAVSEDSAERQLVAQERKEKQKKKVTFVDKKNRREIKALTKKGDRHDGMPEEEDKGEEAAAIAAAERRKSARLEKQSEKRQILKEKGKKEPHKVLPGETSDIEQPVAPEEQQGEGGEKKKRPKYMRAPLGSLANPDLQGMLDVDQQQRWAELL